MIYFGHTSYASLDEKIMALRLQFGGAAVDAYWYVIEQLYRYERPLCVSDAGAMHAHAHNLCLPDCGELKAMIDGMMEVGLLYKVTRDGEEGDFVSSRRVETTLKEQQGRQEKCRSAARKRWDSVKDAKAEPTQCAPNGNNKELRMKNEESMRGNKAKRKADGTPPTRARFTAPSVEDVRAYAKERGLAIDAERFVDFYASKGWMVGKSPMKDWKCAARNWARQSRDAARGGSWNVSSSEYADAF